MKSKKTTSLRNNRTGVFVSPREAKKTLEGAREGRANPAGSEREIAKMRALYIEDSEGIGSLPQGEKKARALGMQLAGVNAPLLFDKISERIAFERSGVRLYDALIQKANALGAREELIEKFLHIRNEELEHFEMLCGFAREMGGDPTVQSPCADVAGVASKGISQVVADPRTTLAQCLSAVLIAERADNDGWELLISLLSRSGQDGHTEPFQQALEEEKEHQEIIRQSLNEEIDALG